uniref:Integrase catalytic domain-containing protein n=1 Tax=Tanacetum cinerariifolium TaxID=118510 RepID=A0A6L2NTE6_TANCI|nr:hypothetical protein [Tanacetum cinerariifolium]
MDDSVISISSNSFEESVGSSTSRVILFGTIHIVIPTDVFTTVPIVLEMAAAIVTPPARVLDLDIHVTSETNPSRDPSSLVHALAAPITSLFLCLDSFDPYRDSSNSDSPNTNHRRFHSSSSTPRNRRSALPCSSLSTTHSSLPVSVGPSQMSVEFEHVAKNLVSLLEPDYPIWQVIQNGNGPVSVITDTNGMIKVLPPKTAEEIDNAKEMWEAIKSRFGGNDESKKMQKYLLKQQFEGFSMSASEGTTASSSSNTQNVAFVSADNTSSTNDVSTAYSVSSPFVLKSHKEGSSSYTNEVIHSFFENQSSAPQLDYDDLEQINDDDMEEMDLKLLKTQMSANDKFGLGYGDYRYGGILSYENEVLQSVFMTIECDLEDTPINDRYAKGMHAVPPPMIGNYMPSGPNVEIDYSKFTYVDNAPKIIYELKVWTDAPIIKDYESDSDDDSMSNVQKNIEKPSSAFIDYVKHVKSPRENVKETGIPNHYSKITKQDRHSHTRKGLGYAFTRKSCFVCGSFSHLIRDCDFHEKRMAKQAALTKSKEKGTKLTLQIIKNLRVALLPLEVTMAITGKGKIKAGKLDFKDAYYVEELKHYNLFFVSQMCDKKNKVLFTDTDCLVLSPDFKLPDKNKVLLKIPRQHNMYSFNLKNIDPSEDLSCLFAKASIDESNKWHRRLGHVNFKNLNKLVKGNLVRGIKREYSNARTPQQDGVAERKNMTLIEATRTMLADSFLPTTFWAEVVNTACYVLNKVLVTKPQNKTPYELLAGKKPIISYLRPFGFHVTILNTIDQLGQFDGNSDSGFLVRYSLNSKAFRVYNLETKRVKENLLVNFLENKPSVAGKGHAWMFDLDYLTNSMNYEPVSLENQANKSTGPSTSNNSAGTQANDDQGANSKKINLHDEHFILPEVLEKLKRQEKEANDAVWKEATYETQDVTTNSTNLLNAVTAPVIAVGPSRALNDDEPLYPDDPSMPHLKDIYASPSEGIFTNSSYDDEAVQTRSKVKKNSEAHALVSYIQKQQRNNHKDFQHCLFACFLSQIEPKKITQALEDESWVDAMQEELMNKKDERGVIVRNKARLVAYRHRQEEGIDYDVVFAPVARIEAIRIFLAFASYMGFIVYQMDVKSALLYGTIDEEVYVTQPPGFIDPKFPNKVYKVVKALYGLQ